VAEHTGLEPTLGGLALVDGSFTRPAAVAAGFVLYRRDIDAGEVA
jgi:hypothetical protein